MYFVWFKGSTRTSLVYDEHDDNDTMMKIMRNNLISITAPILKCFAKMSTKMAYMYLKV